MSCSKEYRARANRAKKRTKRAAKFGLVESYTPFMEKVTLFIFKYKCMQCNSAENLSIDHFYPLSKGHVLSMTNACVLCSPCNQKKSHLIPEMFFSSGKLAEIRVLMDRANLIWKTVKGKVLQHA